MSVWKDLLQGDEIDSPYAQLFMEVVLCAVMRSSINTWQAKHPEPLLRFLYSWERLLPHPALQRILGQIVVPKLLAAVNSWDPHTDSIPMHIWVHPWLPLLGQKHSILYDTVRTKLESVLNAWHPSDVSAYTILSPWKPVFDREIWEQIMVRCISPKLLAVMHEFQVNPADQKLDQYYWDKKSLPEKFRNRPEASILTAFVAASIATLTCYPLDTVRRQMQMRGTPYKSILDAFPAIVTRAGVAGLYRGFVPNALKSYHTAGLLTTHCIKLTTFDAMKRLISASEIEFQRTLEENRTEQKQGANASAF
ncbi:septin and tuftelin-interacting protein 1 homolog 1 [Tanacetum coccineum]